jgi:hypothetical protein
VGEDGELLAEGKLDEGLLTLAAEAGPKRVEQGNREREQGNHDKRGACTIPRALTRLPGLVGRAIRSPGSNSATAGAADPTMRTHSRFVPVVRSAPERALPAQAGKTCEVGVQREDRGAVRERDRGDPGIGRQVAPGAGAPQEL